MNKSKELESELKELCLKMINIFSHYKEKGIIDQDEYEKHTRLKKDFIKNTSSNK
ncbi:hypothetical protein [Thermohalobacter berrensis]|uniref:hypothetical protein n=1 Tax=Thermohalobacter berrensis TaxID=99594 RepID=UPI0015FF8D48|nr:hypothetical protein [Thermohalobacter berrensis]